MVDVITALVGVLLAVLLAATTYAAVEYYKQLRKAQEEYDKTKDTVEDVVLSFNRELKREAEKIQNVTYKVEMNASTAEAGYRKAEYLERVVAPLEDQVNQINTQIESISSTMSSLSEVNVKTLEKISTTDTDEIQSKLQNIESSQEALKNKITLLEEQIEKLAAVPEVVTEAVAPVMPVMPIKRDKAMAALTDTEVEVLEFLSAEGPKTAPEIKEKVKLSREHTARLMKKLYEEGYLERETGKLPFKYSIKKEMENMLKKPEPSST
ncbi:MAG: MarR family transcriptional regulator [Candidatus Bathyarchaeota archaeon]|nr:MarR family transcriptional regulator [Candidatus Bathyarchaeota archaeon]